MFDSFKESAELKLKRKQYSDSLKTVTEHYNGVRINETLAGRIKGIRMSETECGVSIDDLPKIATLRSVPRPKYYGTNLLAWMASIRREAKTIINRNKNYEAQEKEYQERIKTIKDQELLEERRKFLINYGVLPKQVA